MTGSDATAPWTFGGATLASRLLLGTSRYPSPAVMRDAVLASGTAVVTVSLRREAAQGAGGARFWDFLRGLPVRILPNTAGCHTAEEAVTTAHMARDLFDTPWIKLEVIGDDLTLAPDPFGSVKATRALAADGFQVLAYTTADLIVGERLLEAGCQALMPLAAPIGTGRGLVDAEALRAYRARFATVPLIVDAGLGRPSHAAHAMELGFDAVLLNTAVAAAGDPVAMARAFAEAVRGGRRGYEAGLMAPRAHAVPSTPTAGRPFAEPRL